MNSFDPEKKIRDIGRELYSSMRAVPAIFNRHGWIGRLMAWAMEDEDFKVRLFRFIDVLPSLKSDEQLTGLLRQYLGDSSRLSSFQRGVIEFAGKRFVPLLAAPIIRKSIETMASEFIAAKDRRAVLKTLDKTVLDGTRFSVDLLGEIVVSDREAAAYAEDYAQLIDQLGRFAPGVADVSFKISSFDSQLDPVDWTGSITRAMEGIRPVLQKADKQGVSLTMDMEHAYFKNLTIAVFKRLLEEEVSRSLHLGIALQAYLKETEEDLHDLIRWVRERNRKIMVRLVKGAYWDYEVVLNRRNGWPEPVFLNKKETDINFERLTRLLFENADVIRPAIATHNLRSLSHALALAGVFNLDKQDFEFQVLYGMAEPLRKAVRAQGFNVRVYVPVGRLIPGMAYLVRRLLENTSNVSFLRKSFSQGGSFEELIKAPGTETEVSPRGAELAEKSNPFLNEPVLDFSIEENRKKMVQAIEMVKGMNSGFYPLIIGDRAVRTDREIISRNPASPDHVVGVTASASTSECDQAIAEALMVRDQWRRTRPEKRADYLFRAAEEMRKRKFELAALEILEVGKTWKDADGDVAEAIDYLEYYGREMIRLAHPERRDRYPGEENEYRYVPKGIAVVIAPWNFPLAIATGMVSASIVTGNCTIFKPSGLSPIIGFQLCEIFKSVGLPAGVIQFLPGPGNEVGEYLVSHPAVDLIAFTGSKDVGLRIVRLAAEVHPDQRNIKKVIAELGGKNAIIVDETADMDEAVKGIVESAFGYQGQKCSACSRLIVIGDRHDELCKRLVEAASSVRIGPTENPENVMGPVIDGSALQKIRAYVEIGKKKGRAVLEKNIDQEGYFIGPVIIRDVKPDCRIATEEIFGPVLSIMKAKDIEEAIALAMSTQYALTGGLYSRSPANIQKAKEEFMTGNLYINRKITGALVGRQPFGGLGMSGIGSKAGGPDYLIQFMNPLSISENTIRRGFAPFEQE